ncbi:MAG: hypothetical protein ACE5DM_02270 [Candidatus Nanoarchaeia archaeon]
MGNHLSEYALPKISFWQRRRVVKLHDLVDTFHDELFRSPALQQVLRIEDISYASTPDSYLDLGNNIMMRNIVRAYLVQLEHYLNNEAPDIRVALDYPPLNGRKWPPRVRAIHEYGELLQDIFADFNHQLVLERMKKRAGESVGGDNQEENQLQRMIDNTWNSSAGDTLDVAYFNRGRERIPDVAPHFLIIANTHAGEALVPKKEVIGYDVPPIWY